MIYKRLFLPKVRKKLLLAVLSASIVCIGILGISSNYVYGNNAETGWKEESNGNVYWYENGIKQGTQGRGKEIYDSSTDAWYWLDAAQQGLVAKNKDVYQESFAGIFGDRKVYKEDGSIDISANTGKWVRYDANGHMVKGWDENANGKYYFDLTYGSMAKGYATIDGTEYYFNVYTGVLERIVTDGVTSDFTGWKKVYGRDIWYENGIRQGYSTDSSYRGKEIFDRDADTWYWLDNVEDGKKAVYKDVYQESLAGEWGDKLNDRGDRIGKWVRYDGEGKMVKGWFDNINGRYYFDPAYGTMAKENVIIDGEEYTFDVNTGICEGVETGKRFSQREMAAWRNPNYWKYDLETNYVYNVDGSANLRDTIINNVSFTDLRKFVRKINDPYLQDLLDKNNALGVGYRPLGHDMRTAYNDMRDIRITVANYPDGFDGECTFEKELYVNDNFEIAEYTDDLG